MPTLSLLKTLAFATVAFTTLFLFAAANDQAAVSRKPTPASGLTAIALDGDSRIAVVDSSGFATVIACNELESVNVIDSERKIGESLTDVTFVIRAGKSELLATDFKAHVLVSTDSGVRIPTVGFPVCIEADPSRTGYAVAGLWSRQIEITLPDQKFRLDLSFPPGHLCWISDSRLLIADAFGEMIAVVDTASEEIVFEHRMSGHRTGGLCMSGNGSSVLFADQRLNSRARSTRNDVHWGIMIANQLRTLSVDQLLNVKKGDEILLEFETHAIGDTGNGKADPGALVQTGDGRTLVSIGGTGEVALLKHGTLQAKEPDNFVSTGARPIDIVHDDAKSLAYVIDAFDSQLILLDTQSGTVKHQIEFQRTNDANVPVPEQITRGERLFFDAGLSHDSWVSCHSCHVNGHTSGMLNDNMSDGTFHTPKRILTLLGRESTAPFAWTGSSESLEAQTRSSIEITMQSDDPVRDEDVTAIAAFIRTLESPPSVAAARRVGDADVAAQLSESAERGEQLFARLSCADCHQPPNMTSARTVDVGFKDEQGRTEFNPPSLIGIGQRDLFFHDGRADSLRKVFGQFEHQLPRKLTLEEMSDLISYLQTL